MILVKAIATIFVTVGTLYTQNPRTPVMGYVVGSALSVGSFLMGLYSLGPGHTKENGK